VILNRSVKVVRLTDIIKGDAGGKESRGPNKPPDEEVLRGPKNSGYSMKEIGGDLRKSSGPDATKAPTPRGNMQLKGLFDHHRKEPEKKSEEKPRIPRAQIEKVYDTMLQYVRFLFEKARRDEPFNLNEGFKIINFLIRTPDSLDILYGKAVSLKTGEELLFTNFVNVAIYAMKVGVELKYEESRLLQLGLAGLVHNIGMAKVPDHIARSTEKITGENFEMLKKHPIFGAEILKQLGPEYSWLVETVYQEHERENGKGYPQGLRGDQINEYARIIGAVDVYEALTSPRPQRKRFLPYEATKEIVQSQRGFYWPRAVKALLTALSAFPVNSYVRLNSGAIGRVLESSKTAPLRPKIAILFDAKGVAKEKIVDLQTNTLLYITESFAREDLPSQTRG